jgi:peptide/nickel transport system permease protein
VTSVPPPDVRPAAPLPPLEPVRAGAPKSPGFWWETWRRFRRRKLAMLALAFVAFLSLVALLSPAIAGTRPIVCRYKGQVYFPFLGYFHPAWENPVFQRDKFRRRYPENLTQNDPGGWAVWPLSFNDPYRRVYENEWPDRPANPARDQGRPTATNWFGTDQRGVDVFAQMVHGTRIALLVGFVSMGIAATIGILLGSLAGYLGGWIDSAVNRLIELVLCIPTLVLILVLLAIIERPTIWHIMAIIGATGWTSIARLTRGEFLRLKEMDFVAAARATGIGQMRIIFRYILPNALAPVLVPITFGIAVAIIVESSLSFLGFGAPPPNPSWGTLLSAGRSNYQLWWLILFPGIAIFLTVLAYNLIGEGLQEATDPRLREGGRA